MKDNWYKILNVTEDASIDSVRSAYRKLILICHPDKGGDAKDFRKVHEAYTYYLTNQKLFQELDYTDSRLTPRLQSVYNNVLMYIVDCRMSGLNINLEILINCLKMKGVPKSCAKNKEHMKEIIFIGISNNQIMECLKSLNIPISGTRKELINKLIDGQPFSVKGIQLL